MWKVSNSTKLVLLLALRCEPFQKVGANSIIPSIVDYLKLDVLWPLEAALHNICIDFWHNSHGLTKTVISNCQSRKVNIGRPFHCCQLVLAKSRALLSFLLFCWRWGIRCPILAPLFFAKLATWPFIDQSPSFHKFTINHMLLFASSFRW